MPVEIKELIIRAELKDDDFSNQNTSSGQGDSSQNQDIELIVQACVKQVMKIINNKAQR